MEEGKNALKMLRSKPNYTFKSHVLITTGKVEIFKNIITFMVIHRRCIQWKIKSFPISAFVFINIVSAKLVYPKMSLIFVRLVVV